MKGARLGAALAALLLVPSAAAHDGPPYPLLEERAFAGGTLTLYADPDVGVGTFYLYLDDALADVPVTLGAWPADRRLPEATVVTERAEGASYQRMAEIAFDRRGPWMLRVGVPDRPGAQPDAEIVLDVEVTPPGSLGPFDVVWFLSPFLVVAFLWTKAILQRRRHRLSLESP